MSEGQELLDLFNSYQNGRFRVDRVLGVGGMGTVVRAFDTRLKMPRAIKISNPSLHQDEELRRRFENEAAIMAQINHPHIVRVFDSFEIGEHLCMVLEWLDGGTLTDHISVYGPLSARQAVQLTLIVCDALAVAHARKVVHRDIKPDNILFTKDGVPKVGDFGIAHVDQNSFKMTGAATALGTLGYMSPEQIYDSATVDARSDVHAVGATLWVMFSALRPPGLPFVNELDRKPELMDMVPVPLRSIIRKSVDYDPNARFDSIEALQAALRDVFDELPEDPEHVGAFGSAREILDQEKLEQEEPEPTLVPKRTSEVAQATLLPTMVSPRPQMTSATPQVLEKTDPPVVVSHHKRFWIIGVLAILCLLSVFIVLARDHPTDKTIASVPVAQAPPAEKQPLPATLATSVTPTMVVVAPVPEATSTAPVQEPVVEKKDVPAPPLVQKKVESKPKEKKIDKVEVVPDKSKEPEPLKPVVKVEKVSVGLSLPSDDSAHVFVVGASGKVRLPASVKPGTYRVIALFKDQEKEVTVIPSLLIQEGVSVKLSCNSAFANCKVR